MNTKQAAATTRALDEMYISLGFQHWSEENRNALDAQYRETLANAFRAAATEASIEKFSSENAEQFIEVAGEYLTISQAASRYLVAFTVSTSDQRKAANVDWATQFITDLFGRFLKFHHLLDGQAKGVANVALRDGAPSRVAGRQAQPSATPSVQPSTAITEAGMYKNPETGDIFKVQVAVHGSGQLYAKKLVPPSDFGEKATFDYAPGAVRQLRADWRMTLEEAKEFGALYGTCCVCGRTLTRETSIEAGIGPVCAGRL